MSTQSNERIAPQNLEAEEHVLGACLLSARAIESTRVLISAPDFYRESHGTIYNAVLRLADEQIPVDAVTCAAELERQGVLETIGGSARISELAAIVPAASNAEHYAAIVKAKAVDRLFVKTSQQIQKLALNGGVVAHPDEVAELIRSLEAPTVQMDVDTWAPLNLADPEYAAPRDPPEIGGLLYRGFRHTISGLPESSKTLIVYALLLEALRDDKRVAVIDLEMGPAATRRMLTDLGASVDELSSIYFIAPETAPVGGIKRIIEWGADYVLIDAAIGAYDLSALDDNARKDAEAFARTWIRPLYVNGISTILIDHVTKNAETRGKFTIGSERKVGGTDVHLSFEAIKPLSRGNMGLVKVTVHKDRGAFLPRPTAVVFEITSDPVTNAITYTRRVDPHDEKTGEFRPTVLMQIVSKYLERQHEPVAKAAIELEKLGRATYVRVALELLVDEGFVLRESGSRNAQLHSSVRPYRTENDPKHVTSSRSSDLVPTSSHELDTTSSDLVPLVPPLQGGRDERDEVSGADEQVTSSHEDDGDANPFL